MITLIHGDNKEQSRNELNRILDTKKGREVRRLDGLGLTPENLSQALESTSLFGGDVLIIVENLFSKLGKKVKLMESFAAQLAANAQIAEIILWEDRELSKTAISLLGGNVTTKVFTVPKVLFQFLDSVVPGHTENLLPLFHTLLESEASELVFTMLVTRVRQLLQITGGITPSGMQEWQASRLTKQAKFFTIDRLLAMYKKLLLIDYSIKSGTSPFTLKEQLELWLTEV
jgi:DNA polymerase III delta subunit